MSQNTEKKGISAFEFFTIGFGAIVGVGWALSINRWMAGSGGPVPAGVGYLFVLVMMVPIALCYCELTPMLPVAGGGAAFAYKAFGEKMSMVSGWTAFGAFIFMLPWEAIYVTDILTMLIPSLKSGDPLYTINGEGVYGAGIIIGIAIACVITFLNWKGAASAAGFQKIMVIILLAGGLIAIVASLIKFSPSNWQPIYENVKQTNHHSFFGGAMAIMATAPFFMCGFETIPQAVEDASGDVAAVGKTVVMAVTISALFYAILLFTLGGAIPWQEFYKVPSPAASNLLLYAYGGTVGQVLYVVILIGTLAGLITTWNGFFVASPRLLMALARANMVPSFLAKQDPKTGVPINGIILCWILSCLGPVAGLGLIDPLTSFSGTACVTSWMITCYSLIRLRKTQPDMKRPYRIPGGVGTAWFGAIVVTIVWVLLFIPSSPCYMSNMALVIFLCWIAIGLILYLASSKQRAAVTPAQREATMFAKMNEEG